MKFKIDENLPFLIKSLIEKVGDFKVDSVYHENLKGINDKQPLDIFLKEKRILVPLDTDFININQPNYGIIIIRSQRQGKNAIRNLFLDFLHNYDLEKCKERIIIVETTQIRVRKY